MQSIQNDFKTKKLYISNLPNDITEKAIVGLVIWVSPVFDVKFPYDRETGQSKDYAVVTLFRNVSARSALSILKSKTLAGNKISIATDFIVDGKDYSETRNLIGELLPRKNGIDFVSAENLLSDVFETSPDSKVSIKQPQCVQKIKEYVRNGRELTKSLILEVVAEVKKPKPKIKPNLKTKPNQKKKRRKFKNRRPSGLIIISTPMGGQPPRRRRRKE